jgi:hypothetical protein
MPVRDGKSERSAEKSVVGRLAAARGRVPAAASSSQEDQEVPRILAVDPEREPVAGPAHGSGSAGYFLPVGRGGGRFCLGEGTLGGGGPAQTDCDQTHEDDSKSLHDRNSTPGVT